MLDGFYTITFQTVLGSGGGVIILRDGDLKGGDSSMYYSGSFQATAANFNAKLDIATHLKVPGMTSVFGVDSASLDVRGTVQSDGSIVGRATTPVAPEAVLNFVMRKVG